MEKHPNRDAQQDALAGMSPDEPRIQQPSEDTGTDQPKDPPGSDETSNRPDYYKELGMKEQRGTAEEQEHFGTEPAETSMVDKSRVDAHQAEGPGGKGGFGSGGA
jgi:hypothetical protein